MARTVSILLPGLFHLASLYLWAIPRLVSELISLAVGTESMPKDAVWVRELPNLGHQRYLVGGH